MILAWYKEDTNAVPAEYVLQPISQMASSDLNNTNESPRTFWNQSEPILSKTLRRAANCLQSQGVFSEVTAQKYLWSGNTLYFLKNIPC